MPLGELRNQSSAPLSVCATWLEADERLRYGWLFARQGRSADSKQLSLQKTAREQGVELKEEKGNRSMTWRIERVKEAGGRSGGESHEKKQDSRGARGRDGRNGDER
ncbi:hypothetical protein DPEC_G00344530 [Dallia pectoralis]|uniref:Uncharacterized protein n=1 Tax=Dallia pectoralis TaxID=75939 RepID=A0ACC2F395_DALPE|nr:hypothetical protein DPEC_G00344530 [Dallia pectoralis]